MEMVRGCHSINPHLTSKVRNMMKWKIPTHIRFKNCGDFVRLTYRIGDCRITTQGFRTKKEFLKVLRNDNIFKIEKIKNKG